LSPTDRLLGQLTVFLGPHTARMALKTFSNKALGCAPHEVAAADVPRLVDALRPMLRTLLGEEAAESLVAQLKGDA
jgi:hypothetical protein